MAANISEEANTIIPIDFSSVQSLPESHTWSNECFDGGVGLGSVPEVDLMDPNAKEAIGLAFEKWGAVQLKNHGVSQRLIEKVETHAVRLFSLSAEQKLKALRSSGATTGYGQAIISPFFPKHMWHEGFTIMGSPYDDAKKIWPHDHAQFCEIMENYQKEMKSLAEKVTHIILNLLGISEEEKKWVGSDTGLQALQLNSYPCCPDPQRAMGLAPHTDTSLLTILHQAQAQHQAQPTHGLEIFNEEAGWVLVQPQPDALVVHAGDLLHVVSNSRFRSVLHRATVNGTRHRYSFAYFYGPAQDYVLSPVAVDSIPRFRAVTVKEFVAIKAQNPRHALSSITI